MAMLIEALQLRDPVAAFNGGWLVRPNLSAIQVRLIPGDIPGELKEATDDPRIRPAALHSPVRSP
jgi:hypothetical protein